jgi:hypothetical protein
LVLSGVVTKGGKQMQNRAGTLLLLNKTHFSFGWELIFGYLCKLFKIG